MQCQLHLHLWRHEHLAQSALPNIYSCTGTSCHVPSHHSVYMAWDLQILNLDALQLHTLASARFSRYTSTYTIMDVATVRSKAQALARTA